MQAFPNNTATQTKLILNFSKILDSWRKASEQEPLSLLKTFKQASDGGEGKLILQLYLINSVPYIPWG
jgi:hypothetical protein